MPEVRGDIYIGRHNMSSGMHGDRVLVGQIRMGREGRAEGAIQKVLERAHPTLVGEYHWDPRGPFVIPYDGRIPHPILILPDEPSSADETKRSRRSATSRGEAGREMDGLVVNVEIVRFPTPTQSATGKIIEVLGNRDDFGVDVEIIIRKHHLPHKFPDDTLRAAAAVRATISAEELARRRDFRDAPIVTIDGETAKDFDDAVAVFPLPNGNFELQVHIADVSHYVHPGTPLDREARLRGTSVYFPDRAVPMLPAELSSGICSLKPQEDRLVLSAIMEVSHQGEILRAEFSEGVIRSAERMTYTAVNAVLENDTAARKRYASLAAHFERMRDLALILNRKRERMGAIDFDLPEPVIQFDENGVMTGITRSERNIAHRLIEEFMLSANEAVARFLQDAGVASLYRIHEKPDPAKVMEFEEIAGTFGYTLGMGPLPVRRFPIGKRRERLRRGQQGRTSQTIELPAGGIAIFSRNYQHLTDQIAGKPEERILTYLMLRSLKQACYRELNVGHFALALDCYTHFTSPIRRYPDLVVHRILRSVLSSRRTASINEIPRPTYGLPDPINAAELDDIAIASSQAERRADDAERELIEWKQARFMRDRLGDEFEALITSVGKFGFFVELIELFIEGIVPIETMTDQRYFFREQDRQWVGERTRRRFKIGDRLRVQLDRVGEMGGKMAFSVVG
jgi:ribonuclease R